MKKKKDRLQVHLPHDIVIKLRIISAKLDLPMSEVIEKLIVGADFGAVEILKKLEN